MNGSPTHPACKHERGTTAVGDLRVRGLMKGLPFSSGRSRTGRRTRTGCGGSHGREGRRTGGTPWSTPSP